MRACRNHAGQRLEARHPHRWQRKPEPSQHSVGIPDLGRGIKVDEPVAHRTGLYRRLSLEVRQRAVVDHTQKTRLRASRANREGALGTKRGREHPARELYVIRDVADEMFVCVAERVGRRWRHDRRVTEIVEHQTCEINQRGGRSRGPRGGRLTERDVLERSSRALDAERETIGFRLADLARSSASVAGRKTGSRCVLTSKS